ncbi:MAG TPA: hypothetical protein VGG06_18865 [Thermoanaerobaculia bacterium]|jgi:hypothetical protein
MTFVITADMTVERDSQGRIRQIRHPEERYGGFFNFLLAAETPPAPMAIALAAAYVREVLPLYELDEVLAASFLDGLQGGLQPLAAVPLAAFPGPGLKKIGENLSVGFPQNYDGLPVWNSGFLVQMRTVPNLAATGSTSYLHSVDLASESQADPPFAPEKITVDVLGSLLGLEPPEAYDLEIHASEPILYRFRSSCRAFSSSPPPVNCDANLRLPLLIPVLPAIFENAEFKTFHSARVCFSYTPTGSDARRLCAVAFIEVSAGHVLFVRHLGANAADSPPISGAIFSLDPLSRGHNVDVCAPVEKLDEVRDMAPLEALLPADDFSHHLRGRFVEIRDFSRPQSPPPVVSRGTNFVFHANSLEFAAVNAYYHSTRFFLMMEEMGFDVPAYFTGTRFPVQVDHRSVVNCAERPNAEALSNPLGTAFSRLAFGLTDDCGISLAVCRRVVLHELGHAVLWSHLHWPSFCFAHSPGDSLAAILCDPDTVVSDPDDSKRFHTFPWISVPGLRARFHNRRASEGYAWGGEKDDGARNSEEILTTTLFRVYDFACGPAPNRDRKLPAAHYMTYLILKAIGLLHPSTNPQGAEDFADKLIHADVGTFRSDGNPQPLGLLKKVIRWSFEVQGAYKAPDTPLPSNDRGEPPAVDLYIHNSLGGEYDRSLVENYGKTGEIWNRHQSDGETEDEHEQALPGADNFCYLRLRNRGANPAVGVIVRGYQSSRAREQIWPDDWRPLADPKIELEAPVPPRSEVFVTVGPFRWQPHSADDALLFAASVAGDRCNLESLDKLPVASQLNSHSGARPTATALPADAVDLRPTVLASDDSDRVVDRQRRDALAASARQPDPVLSDRRAGTGACPYVTDRGPSGEGSAATAHCIGARPSDEPAVNRRFVVLVAGAERGSQRGLLVEDDEEMHDQDERQREHDDRR